MATSSGRVSASFKFKARHGETDKVISTFKEMVEAHGGTVVGTAADPGNATLTVGVAVPLENIRKMKTTLRAAGSRLNLRHVEVGGSQNESGGFEMEFMERCREYADKGLYNMLASYATGRKQSLMGELAAANEDARTKERRMSALGEMADAASILEEIASSRSVARSPASEKCVVALREAAECVYEAMSGLSVKRVVDDSLSESFDPERAIFLSENIGPGTPYHDHFQEYLKNHPKAKGKLKNLSHEERKQLFRDAGAAWREKKAKAGAAVHPDDKK